MKTAVEWLEDNLLSEPWAEEHFKHNSECWDKAKEMEKEQIINCCIQTTQDCYIAIMGHLNAPLQFTDEDLSNQKLEAEQYYNETFNK